MNLKESFRYQNFLDNMLSEARCSIGARDHALVVTKNHLRNKSNPEATDFNEVIEVDDFTPNDDVIEFMLWLISEREKLTEAICKAKNSLSFCFDAALEANKFRQNVSNSIKGMLRYTSSKKTEQGRDYKFNVEGNQTPYYYDIETVTAENFNRKSAKDTVRKMIAISDSVSSEIDSAMINTIVDYVPVFDVNDSFDDVIAEFLENYNYKASTDTTQ